jgi:hypothetical protein
LGASLVLELQPARLNARAITATLINRIMISPPRFKRPSYRHGKCK